MPIRIVDVSPSSFRFEIGFIRAPEGMLNNDFCVKITPKGEGDIAYEYARERFNIDGITYLSVGDQPYEKYALSFKNGNDKLYQYWSKEVSGIDPEGSFFEKDTGKKLAFNDDVEVGKEYYLLKRGTFHKIKSDSVRVQHVVRKNFGWKEWNLYIVSATDFNEEAARFYLDFHCLLTDNPVSMQPVWPPYVEGNYIVKHNLGSMYMLVNGHTLAFNTFPPAKFHDLSRSDSESKIYEIFCSKRQQLISTGRTHVLKYTYLWKEPLDMVGKLPKISVTDLSGHEIAPGETDILPRDKTLCFKSDFDGELVVLRNDRVIDKQKMSAGKYAEIDGISYGLSIQVSVGLDIVWQISFGKTKICEDNDEDRILNKLTNASGTMIPAPHPLKTIMVYMKQYPKVCKWIRKCIMNDSVSKQAYRMLQEFYIDKKMNERGGIRFCHKLDRTYRSGSF